jgi:hypothetical protein
MFQSYVKKDKIELLLIDRVEAAAKRYEQISTELVEYQRRKQDARQDGATRED